jgi:hypothetical protein
VKSEVDLAEKGSSFEQQLISKMLSERPDESGQIENLSRLLQGKRAPSALPPCKDQ